MSVSLLFQEKQLKNGIAGLRLYLHNDFERNIIVQYTLSVKGDAFLHESFTLNSNEIYALGDIVKDLINDRPTIFIEIRALTTEGSGEIHEKKTKIRTQLFMKAPIFSDHLQSQAYKLELFHQLAYKKAKENKIKDQIISPNIQRSLDEDMYREIDISNPAALAHFNNVVDLHIHALHDNPNTLRKSEILNLQIAVFKEELERAIGLGIERIFFIHGIGTGRLKNEITTYLFNHPGVISFKNEYHPKYGGGATEAILKD